MAVYVSESMKTACVNTLSEEIRNDIMIAVEEKLNQWVPKLSSDEFQRSWDSAFASRVCDLEGTIQIDYVKEDLSFYVVENLRHQQNGTGGFKISRYDKLEDAIYAFAALPKEYTSALGGSLTGGKFGVGEIDFIHRKNGEVVQVNDFKFSPQWDNPLVLRASQAMNSKLGVEYESDLRMFGNKTVLVPLCSTEDRVLNSYYMDKYLRPAKDAEYQVGRKYGDLSMYDASSPVHSLYLNSAVNEVMVGGQGWVKGEDFFKKLDSIDEYGSPERLKVMKLNINYVDLNGRIGQADINPHEFALLKKQTIEKTARHPAIDVQIAEASKVQAEQMNKGKQKNKEKETDLSR